MRSPLQRPDGRQVAGSAKVVKKLITSTLSNREGYRKSRHRIAFQKHELTLMDFGSDTSRVTTDSVLGYFAAKLSSPGPLLGFRAAATTWPPLSKICIMTLHQNASLGALEGVSVMTSTTFTILPLESN